MCGIAGIIGSQNIEVVKSMLAATKHRGPDDSGIYSDENCTLGMNRLSIIDVSLAGHQPMMSDDKRYIIVYNGEVYNYAEIRTSLIKLGFSFHSNTDTEVVLKGYMAFGKAILHKVRGMFAFVIWDTHTQSAFGARDHMGIKPFLYSFKEGIFTFCSEIKGMLQQSSIPKIASKEGLQLYLSYGYIGAPYTILKDVFSLKPGECFVFQNGEFNISTYWDIPTYQSTYLTYDQAQSKLKELVLSKVKEELVSDVPLGLFLSGGLDSTVVLAAMRLAGNQNIDTFSLGFDGFEASEEKEAEIAATYYQTNHHTHIISGKMVSDEFDGFIEAMDQPCIDGLNIYLVSKYSKQHVTVTLSGLGPDELFLGYKWQRSAASPLKNPILFNALLPALNHMWPKRYISILEYLKNVQDPITFYSTINRVLSEQEMITLGLKKTGHLDHTSWVSSYDIPTEKDIYARISRLDMKLFMGARVLPISDATSMYHSLEVRFPFIDKDIVEFSRTLPASYKMNIDIAKKIRPWTNYEGVESYQGSGVKKILFEAFKSELPDGFGTRAKKGFKFPYKNWINNELKDFHLVHTELNQIPDGWQKLILLNWLKKYKVKLND
jgi:asparagine synthase (glutamine-hydrolysing)